ncbi:MAG: LysM peptidoglycan-binding domain-containing protein [Aggregatilineales bacterium]
MPTLPMRPLRRAAGLIIFASLMSGCFQTAGAALQATMTPQGGAAITVASPLPTAQVPPPTAITPIALVSTLTATVPQLVFATATGIPALPADTLAATNTLPVTDTPIPTNPPTLAFTQPSQVPAQVLTNMPTNIPTNIPLPTATLTHVPSKTPTEPPIITPTQNIPGTKIALQATFDSQSATQTQQAIFDQATSIVGTATAGAAAQYTQIATLQGTGIPSGVIPTVAPGQPPATPIPNGTNSIIVELTFTPTPLPSINSSPQSGAMGNITNGCLYTVVDGDRLFRIALRFSLTPYQLAYANRLINPDLVVPGEVLRIPGCANPPTNQPPAIGVTPGSTAVPGTPGAVSAAGQTYMVIDGDTLYSIATRFGVRVIALAQANGITNLNLIYIGQNLTIP